jgi:hypothetical protein
MCKYFFSFDKIQDCVPSSLFPTISLNLANLDTEWRKALLHCVVDSHLNWHNLRQPKYCYYLYMVLSYITIGALHILLASNFEILGLNF